jgi:Flp pilus assembly protein TadD
LYDIIAKIKQIAMANQREEYDKKLAEDKEPLMERKWVKYALRIFVVLAVIICGILVFRYSGELKDAASKTFGFTNNIYDKIFNRNDFSPASVSETGTSTIATTVTSTVETATGTENTTATSVIAQVNTTTTADATTINGSGLASTSTSEISTSDIGFAAAVSQSRVLWANGKYGEALDMAHIALQKAQSDEEKAKAYYWIGLCYYYQGNKQDAENAELLAIKYYPDYEPPYVTLSAIKLDENKCDEALTYALRAVQLNGKDCWAFNDLGLAYFCLGDKENAAAQLNKAASLAPNSNIILNNLNIVLESLGG